MSFQLPMYTAPDFSAAKFLQAPNCRLEIVNKDGIAPKNYHALSVYPEYFKVNNKWLLAVKSRMDSVCVVDNSLNNESLRIVEFRNLKAGDKVVVGRSEDASEGIYVYTDGFSQSNANKDTFAFRSGRSRETAFSKDYDNLYDILRYEKANNGYVTWVLGSAVTLDQSARSALTKLIEEGYVNSVICCNALAVFDLEKAIFGSTWGQAVFQNDGQDNYNYYRTINLARSYGSLEDLVASGKVKDGFVKACVENKVPLLIAGTIRDRFILPCTYDNVYEAQDAMRAHTQKLQRLSWFPPFYSLLPTAI